MFCFCFVLLLLFLSVFGLCLNKNEFLVLKTVIPVLIMGYGSKECGK